MLEEIVAKPSDFIRRIYYYHIEPRNGSTKTKINPTLDNPVLSPHDTWNFGRCFTALPTEEMIQRRITRVIIYPKITKVRGHGIGNHGGLIWFTPAIFLHMPKMFKEIKFHGITAIYADMENRHDFTMDFQVHTKQEVRSVPSCEGNLTYDYEGCVDNYIEIETLRRFGCTTPFGRNKEHICDNVTIASQVLEVYKKYWGHLNTTSCKVPCKTYTMKPIWMKKIKNTHKTRGYTSIVVQMDDKILVSKEVFVYSFLSLVAEIGGYVGLFLGVSVKQIPTLIPPVQDFFAKIAGKFFYLINNSRRCFFIPPFRKFSLKDDLELKLLYPSK